jgi:hypothetical protein
MRTLRAAVALLGSVIATRWAGQAWAWGDLGHKIICEIAFQELNDTARREVRRLIRLDPDFNFFADSCTWPDHPRKRASEHFINAPRDFDRFLAAQCPMATTCLFTAITTDLEVLRTSTDDQAKLDALKFLGHWIGDLHQPLHVSFEDDRRGGKIKESGPCLNNLHSVWDTCIIERELGDRPRDVAQALLDEITASDRASWVATPVAEWANESFEITRQATVAYCVRVGNTCRYEEGNEQFDAGETEKTVTVDAAYLQTHGPVVAERLKRAGVRLGHLLNTSLGE